MPFDNNLTYLHTSLHCYDVKNECSIIIIVPRSKFTAATFAAIIDAASVFTCGVAIKACQSQIIRANFDYSKQTETHTQRNKVKFHAFSVFTVTPIIMCTHLPLLLEITDDVLFWMTVYYYR